MIKKIVSSIILIMIICLNCVFATNVVVPEDTNNSSQETVNPEDTTTDNDSENQNPDTAPDVGTDTEEDSESNVGEDNNTSEEINTENNGNANNSNQNQGSDSNQSGSSVQKPSTDTPQTPVTIPTQNNPGGSINNSQQVTKSSEARLKELKVDVEGLSPEFDKNTTEYYLVVDLSVEKVNITAKSVDNKAKVTISGNKNLEEGENTITISVKAEDETTKKYYIYVTKVDDVELANAELESLEIEGFNLYPSFKSNIYSYNLNINEEIEKLNITATSQNENATIEIEGNENLQEGDNLIKINVTAENEESVRTYKINVFIDSDRVEIEEESKLPAIVLIVVMGTCIIALGISIVVKKRR